MPKKTPKETYRTRITVYIDRPLTPVLTLEKQINDEWQFVFSTTDQEYYDKHTVNAHCNIIERVTEIEDSELQIEGVA
jgi:hypothetical protein